MRKKGRFILISFFVLLVLFTFSCLVLAVSEEECLKKKEASLEEYISCLQELYEEVGKKGETLAVEIARFDAQIALTSAKISQTQKKIGQLEEEIAGLSGKIDRLDTSLDRVSAILASRITATYKRGNIDPLVLFFSSDSFASFLNRYQYLKVIQRHDKKLLLAMEETRNNFETQKSLKEEKQEELERLEGLLESQKASLAQQKRDKEYLLAVTKQDEKRYQQLLAAARAEFEALQAIMAGQGDEVEVGKVSEREKIATIIGGSSCNSSGEHLHFMVVEDRNSQNPFGYLKSVDYTNCSGSACGSGDGDPFNPSGDWDWPVDSPIKFMQGFGSTWAVAHTWVSKIYSSHNGIDIQGSSREVRAVRSGTLYRGSYTGQGGCRLQYVKVDHDENNIDSYYAHVYYL